jgi:histidine triad (HIT) family protein
MADDCIFCRIVRREIPATIVHEDDHCVAIRDINPQAPVHIVIITRDHVASLDSASDPAQLGALSIAARDLARKEKIAKSGYRTVVNTNSDGGQTVFHLHMHLLGGRHMTWPPG